MLGDIIIKKILDTELHALSDSLQMHYVILVNGT